MKETGRINITRNKTDNGYNFNFKWVGGDIVGISNEILADGDLKIIAVADDLITIGPYHLRIVERKATHVLAQKINTLDTILWTIGKGVNAI